MSVKFSDFDFTELSLSSFATSENSDVSFANIILNGTNLIVDVDVTVVSDLSEFMGNIICRATINDVYAETDLRSIEKFIFDEFEKTAGYSPSVTKRELFFKNLLSFKLKAKENKWTFTCNDKTFTLEKKNKLKKDTILNLTLQPGFYYNATHCGMFLTVKNVSFVKPKMVLKK